MRRKQQWLERHADHLRRAVLRSPRGHPDMTGAMLTEAVTPGARVVAGDVLGYVGNTGNARTTSPHLHFGIYAQGDGAVDPFPFVVDPVMQRHERKTRTSR